MVNERGGGAGATHGSPGPGGRSQGPVPLRTVLWEELRHLGRIDDPGDAEAPELQEVYARIGSLPPQRGLSALCISGGGIRSATFNLGVLQALAARGLLRRFDYLSSVSGGGYIAGWLKAWMHREPVEKVEQALAAPASAPGFRTLAPEPKPLDHLREYSNYLTPRLGLFSADTWTAAALVVRNLILNWLVLLPVLTALVAVPQAALIVASLPAPGGSAFEGALGASVLFALLASFSIYHFRRSVKRARESEILMLSIAPLWLATLSLALAALWQPDDIPEWKLALFCALWSIAIPALGWAAALGATGRGRAGAPSWRADLLGLSVSGAAAGVLLFALARSWLPALIVRPPLFVLFAVPLLLGTYLLARALFVAFASLGDGKPAAHGAAGGFGETDSDREWWARISGWVLLLSLGWIVASGMVVLGGFFLKYLSGKLLAAMGGLSGIATALLGAQARTGSSPDSPRSATSPARELALKLLAPATLLLLVLGLAMLSAVTARALLDDPHLLRVDSLRAHLELPQGKSLWHVVLLFAAVPLGYSLLSWLLGWVVDVNRFSAQGLYRNRLIRAYLGASNTARVPDPFTGFAADDDLPLAALRDGASPRPLPVVNVTLNLVRSSEDLAWQQRKAESFSMTPLFCGNFYEGYRRSEEYGGERGISLGTAMTISGAAANPSAGYHSSPLVSFLMTLFNVRLGSWLGNPNDHGEPVYRRAGPRHAWKPLFADLLGLSNAKRRYVSLSDGGHFENLGVYEMVLRRCRLIVACDAGHDERHDFEDLANLIRKVRIDFGIPIEFCEPIRIVARGSRERAGLLCAFATVHYERVDPGTPPGTLLYLKPTLLAAGPPVPYDVFGYARVSNEFPHEPTSDQWFSEAQFESYRALGRHLAAGLLPQDTSCPSLHEFLEAVRTRLAAAAATPGIAPPDGLRVCV